MTWQGPLHAHVSQIHPATGSGAADCWQASLTRYLYESGRVPLDRNQWDVINEVSLASRGTPDGTDNADTNLQEAGASLAHYGIPVQWTDSYQAALAAPWSILLVNGILLSPAQYPASFFGGANWPDHFVLWLPQLQGASNWFNDPLAYNNGQQDCQYDLASVAEAFGGGYILPSTNRGETAPPTVQVLQRCSLKAQPNHTSTGIGKIPATAHVQDLGKRITTGKEVWARVQWDSTPGWVLASNIHPV